MPFRQDEIISPTTAFSSFGVMIILLILAYFALRYYAKHILPKKQASSRGVDDLRCVSELRLSSRTKIYVVRVNHVHEFVVVESPTGSVIQPIEKKNGLPTHPVASDELLGR